MRLLSLTPKKVEGLQAVTDAVNFCDGITALQDSSRKVGMIIIVLY